MRMRDRVTILGLNFAPEPTGNAPYTAGLARHLDAAGARVTVLTTFPHYPQWRRYAGYSGWRSEANDHGVRLVRLRHFVPNPPRGLRRLLSEISFGVRLLVANWHRPTAVVLVSPALFSSWLAMLRLQVQRTPRRIVWVQDLYSQGMDETGEGGGLAQGVARSIEGWTLRRAHMVVAIHDTMASRMTTSLRVKRDRIVVIPNWSHVAPVDMEPGEARAHLNWADCFTVLHAGNIGLKQGLDVLIETAQRAAARQLPIQFILLGDGGERKRLEQLALGLTNLHFVEPVSDAEFPIALAAADALLVTEATGVSEMAAPSKLTSYFAARRPVIASVSSNGIVAKIMAAAQAGPVTRGGDALDLLTAVDLLAHNPEWRERAAKNAKEYWQEQLGPDRALTAWERVLSATILGGAARGETE